MLDKEKLLRDMTNRYNSLNDLINRDHANSEKLYERWMEVKFWKEAIFDRGVYDKKV